MNMIVIVIMIIIIIIIAIILSSSRSSSSSSSNIPNKEWMSMLRKIQVWKDGAKGFHRVY